MSLLRLSSEKGRTYMKSRISPFYRLVSFIFLFVYFLLADSLFDASIVVLVMFLSMHVCNVNARKVVYPLLRLYGFYITVFLFNALFQEGETVYWSWWIFTLTKEGMMTGIAVIIRVFIVSILANILTLGMSASELSNAIGMLLSPLRLLHVPVENAAFMISQAFSFIPRLTEDAEYVGKSMRARGANLGKLKIARMVLPLSISAFRRADDMAMALTSRGYDGYMKRRKVCFTPTVSDILSVLVSLIILIIGVFI